ncbi:hypothetical protein SRABI26_02722 [Arthrobacter sp. Bi26]|uniref:major capsid protein n=1 Tax=Arthrobacter sp. Bi26 TaxID=2822350 RepID=UPI001DD20ACE|nr:major capsid protein [Arthrobacter sp. Bi26]CAH0233898.1 hypothetical protein SRABI26_02722 [Arthrobacter sp. Bi26]
MALWTDLIDPAELTGYARAALSDIEQNNASLARFLPNREVADTVVKFTKGESGLVQEAAFRAYDAEPEIAGSTSRQRVILELPALGQNRPVSEYQQLRSRNASDEAIRNHILTETRNVVRAVADRMERLRGTVLVTGKATIAQSNFVSEDDFGRAAGHTLTASSLWSAGSVDRLADLQAWTDIYTATNNGTAPGALLMSRRVFRALSSGAQFATLLANGATRPALAEEVRSFIAGAGLPEIVIYDRSTSGGRVIPDDRLLFLPAPVDPNDGEGSQLGTSFWGQTLTSMDSNWGIEDSEQPGVVAGVYRNEKPPMIAEVISDAIALPVLANANLSLVAKVL